MYIFIDWWCRSGWGEYYDYWILEIVLVDIVEFGIFYGVVVDLEFINEFEKNRMYYGWIVVIVVFLLLLLVGCVFVVYS